MSNVNKRKEEMQNDQTPKRVKRECSYGDKCFRKNPAHFREYSHAHLEAILDAYTGNGEYPIPEQYELEKFMFTEQLDIIVDKQLYVPKKKSDEESSKTSIEIANIKDNSNKTDEKIVNEMESTNSKQPSNNVTKTKEENKLPANTENKPKDPDYRPIVPPTRKIGDYFKVVAPVGKMAEKHEARAPYYYFYTTITDAPETHRQPYSITFQEILDPSLGELKCSLQINFMVDISWLLAQYYFAGYSEKKMTVLYGDDMPDIRDINKKKPHIESVRMKMTSPFGTHHSKLMILCYEDGSLRVVVSTANLYPDDWENRTQGLWFSPRCPELPPSSMPHEGDSPTLFKKYLLKYLNHYHLPQLSYYVERVKRCDFTHINVFLISSAPGGYFDMDWGLTRAGTLLRQHCMIPQKETGKWALFAQASSLGSFGKEPKIWLTGDYLHNFTKIKAQPQALTPPPELKLIYPSLENVRQSHDDLLGGGCLPYGADTHTKQLWLKDFMYQWRSTSINRNKAMPHVKSYTRISPDLKNAAFFLLTSANLSKAAWGSINKGNGALRIMNYEVGVMFIPRFVINEDFFPLSPDSRNRLILPYDIPPVKYASDMSPWVSDYLR